MVIPELRRLQDILSSFLGSPKTDVSDNGQLQYNCPKCIEEKGVNEIGKYNLEVNLLRGVFMCWSCCTQDDDMKGPIKRLITRYGGKEALREYEFIVSDMRANKLYNLPEYKNLFINNEHYLHLPLTYKKVNLNTCRTQVRDYLLKRRITQDIIDKYKIGYTSWEEEKPIDRNRIIIPSYSEDGSLNYWVGRDFTGNKLRQKYKNCEGVEKTSIVFQESLIQWDADITLVEGAIDVIYGNNTASFLGKSLKEDDALALKLQEKANANVIICLDNDTQDREIEKIYNVLNKGRLKGHIRYIKMNKYKDFGEAYEAEGRRGIIDILQDQKSFSEFQINQNRL